jgi:hypothetical protein
MIVARGGFTIGRSGDSVRRRTLLETVRGPRYSANMCSVNIFVGHKHPTSSSATRTPTGQRRRSG